MKSRFHSTAVFYGRVSGMSQTKTHKDGFRRQRSSVERFAKEHGTEVVGEYLEKAVSGTKTLDERPAFQEMLTDLLGNGCRTIVVESLDRLAREYRVQEQILIYLTSKGLTLIAANTGEDVTEAIAADPMKKALVQIQGIFAELDKSQLVLKLRKAREAKKKRGQRCEGAKPFGYYDGEKEILRRMRTLRRKPRNGKRKGFTQIAEILNTEGHQSRSGSQWTRQSVYSALKRSGRERG